jgi:hypothetical protein
MKKILVLLLALFHLNVFASTESPGSEAPKWEIWFINFAALNVNTVGYTGFSTSTTSASISLFSTAGVSIGRVLTPNLEVLLTPYLYNVGELSSSSTVGFGISGGVAYSFMPVMEESVYVTAQVGIVGYSGSPTSPGFTWSASVGKRFRIIDHVQYNPAITASGTAYQNLFTVTNFAFVPLQVSILL